MSPTKSPESTSVKRKASHASTTANPSSTSSPVTNFTSRNPPWTYLKLQLIHQPGTSSSIQSQPLDPLTARAHLTSALTQFLGLTGTTISIDILKVGSPEPPTPTNTNANTTSKTVWIRIPSDDAPAVVAALSSWIGGNTGAGGVGSVAWRVCAKGNFLAALVNGSGGDLFVPA